jgi:hypothetical protein
MIEGCPYINEKGLCPTTFENDEGQRILEWKPCNNQCEE